MLKISRTSAKIVQESLLRLKRRIAFACRIAYNEGLHEELGSEYAGHISVRENSGMILMPGHLHEYARGLGDMTSSDIISVDLDGNVIEGNLKPVDEVFIHTCIYKKRPEINSIVHLHPPAATALGSTDGTIIPISLRGSLFAEGIPVLTKGPRLIDDEKIASQLAAKLGDRKAVIHKGHGAVTAGRTLEEACYLMVCLEGAARNQILASQLGRVIPFDKKAAVAFARKADPSRSIVVWRYYESKWKKFEPQ